MPTIPVLTFCSAARVDGWALHITGAAMESFVATSFPMPLSATLAIVVEVAPDEMEPLELRVEVESPDGQVGAQSIRIVWPENKVLSTRRRWPVVVQTTLPLVQPGVLTGRVVCGGEVLAATEITVRLAPTAPAA